MSRKPIIRFESTFDQARQAWIYCASGKLVGCDLCYDFLHEARGRIGPEAPHVVLDLSGVTMLNSTGIGIVASLCTSTGEVGGKVYLAGGNKSIHRPLTATHMWGLITKCDSVDTLPETL